MKLEVVILTSAYNDLEQVVDYYETKVDGLGKRMELDFWKSVEFIQEYPLTNSKKYKFYRQARLKKFPYAVIYEILMKEIIIYRVTHLKMQPKKRYKI